MKMSLAAFAALAFLAGCCCTPKPSAEAAPPPVAAAPQPQPQPDTCGMARFQNLIGTPASAIDRATLPPRTRIIAPNSIVTQDFSAERLNILTGADGKVSSLRCF